MTYGPESELRELFARQLAAETQPGDAERLQEWLTQHPSNEAQWNALQRIWSERGTWVHTDVERANRRVLEAIRTSEREGARDAFTPELTAVGNTAKVTGTKTYNDTTPQQGYPRRFGLSLLAAALLLGGVGIVWKSNIFAPSQGSIGSTGRIASTNAVRIYSAAKGERAIIQLVEGTQVVLAAGSTLEVDDSFNSGNRSVTVNGEAFFDVRHKSTTPFVVHAGGTLTRVLGTRFAVRAYVDEPQVQVVVADGKVAVRSLASQSNDVTLTRNELLHVDRQSQLFSKQSIDAAHYTAWAEGRFEFVSTPLRDVVRELERWYDVRIVVPDSTLAATPVSASTEIVPIDELLSRLSEALDVRYIRSGKTIQLISQ